MVLLDWVVDVTTAVPTSPQREDALPETGTVLMAIIECAVY